MKEFQRKFLRARQVRKGVGIAEYAVLVGVIVIGVHLALEILRDDIEGKIDDAKDVITAIHTP